MYYDLWLIDDSMLKKALEWVYQPSYQHLRHVYLYSCIWFLSAYMTCYSLQLYNVVVDTEMTGKKLLQKGELKRRYTIIPLNKISARSIDDNVVRRAQSLVKDPTSHDISVFSSLSDWMHQSLCALSLTAMTNIFS